MSKFVNYDSDVIVDQLVRDYDETQMPLPNIECEPHLLISKVRKHYMEYMIKILSTNYETNQRLLNKNIYLPSAIWKCAKNLEMKAAQTCMVVQLYRKSIVTMINEVKNDTKKGRLHNRLYESLHHEPKNEKRTQTTVTGESGQCQCNEKKGRCKRCSSVKPINPIIYDQPIRDNLTKQVENLSQLVKEHNNLTDNMQRIPVVTNMQMDHLPMPEVISTSQPQLHSTINQPTTTPNNVESDDVMQQLEALFNDEKDDDDLFSQSIVEDNSKRQNNVSSTQDCSIGSTQDCISAINSTQYLGTLNGTSVFENHAAQMKSLDARLVELTGLLANNEAPSMAVVQPQKVIVKKPKHPSKWLCEEYFLKKNLFELLYQIGDNNRHKLLRIKERYKELFGEDSDDEEGIVSPVDSPQFVVSCKARIDGWVLAVLAPYYIKGRIQGKALYKGVAKHLIDLIYKCKSYPSRHEVTSFVKDFLETRGKIRCEADFKEFRIDNVNVSNSAV